MQERNSRSGVSWFDVGHYLRDIARTHHGFTGIVIDLPVRELNGTAICVRVRFRRAGVGRDGWEHERGVSSGFPTREAATLSGLALRLCIELDKQLSEEEHRHRSERQEPLPF